jgi:hypothetical protein
LILQGDDSSTETKQDKPKQDDPVVDLFPDDDTEERNSKLPELFFRGRWYLRVVWYFVLIYELHVYYLTGLFFTFCTCKILICLMCIVASFMLSCV